MTDLGSKFTHKDMEINEQINRIKEIISNIR
jgi:hypothetical protein